MQSSYRLDQVSNMIELITKLNLSNLLEGGSLVTSDYIVAPQRPIL